MMQRNLGALPGTKNTLPPIIRMAYAACVSSIVAVPVTCAPPGSLPRYVLEIEICPRSVFTKQLIFSHINERNEKVKCIRIGNQILASTNQYFAKRSLEDTVRDQASQREESDLEDKRVDLEALAAELSDKEGAVDKAATKKFREAVRALYSQLQGRRQDVTNEEMQKMLTLPTQYLGSMVNELPVASGGTVRTACEFLVEGYNFLLMKRFADANDYWMCVVCIQGNTFFKPKIFQKKL